LTERPAGGAELAEDKPGDRKRRIEPRHWRLNLRSSVPDL